MRTGHHRAMRTGHYIRASLEEGPDSARCIRGDAFRSAHDHRGDCLTRAHTGHCARWMRMRANFLRACEPREMLRWSCADRGVPSNFCQLCFAILRLNSNLSDQLKASLIALAAHFQSVTSREPCSGPWSGNI
jgi:hypothetical protein